LRCYREAHRWSVRSRVGRAARAGTLENSAMTNGRFQILGIAGSLRRASYNRGLIRAAQQLVPDGVEIRTFDLLPIPLYNADVEAAGDPAAVRELKESIRAADALLIATPEYNY